jgi:hypothetical protein
MSELKIVLINWKKIICDFNTIKFLCGKNFLRAMTESDILFKVSFDASQATAYREPQD